jgi:hypothetical protein
MQPAKIAKRFFASCFLVIRVAPITDETDPPRQFSLSLGEPGGCMAALAVNLSWRLERLGRSEAS